MRWKPNISIKLYVMIDKRDMLTTVAAYNNYVQYAPEVVNMSEHNIT